MSNPQHPAGRPPGKEHIPIYPAGFIAIRYVQLILALVILALAAYGVFLPSHFRASTNTPQASRTFLLTATPSSWQW
jgi:hypothetical protein